MASRLVAFVAAWAILAIAGFAAAEPLYAGAADPPISDDDGTVAHAATPHIGPSAGLPSLADLDGSYFWLGPVGSLVVEAGDDDRDAGADSAFGGLAAVTVVHEARVIATRGVMLGATRRASGARGTVWLEAIAGTRRVLPVHVGVTLGPALWLAELAHPTPAVTASLWALVGPTVFVRATANTDRWELGVGLSILLPARRW